MVRQEDECEQMIAGPRGMGGLGGAPRRVLYVTHNAPGNVLWGTELNLLDLIDGLDRERWQPFAAMVQESGAMEESLRARDIRLLRTRVPRPSRLNAGSVVAAMRAAEACWRELDGARPDLVHVNHRWAARTGLLLARRLGVPAVLQLHGRPKPHHYFTDGAALAEVVVANSRSTAEAWSWWPARRKVAVVHNGTRLADFRANTEERRAVRRELGLSEAEFVIGCVARGTAEKGHLCLIQALASSGFHEGVVALLIGVPPVGYRPIADAHVHEIHRLIAGLGVGKRVRLLGFRTDVPRLLNGLDVVAIPSLQESFGRVAVEAMATSLPVAATRVGGLPEIVVEGETGLLVPPGKAAALAQGISRLRADQGLRLKMGENGRRRAEQHFSMEGHIARMTTVYEAALRGIVPTADLLLQTDASRWWLRERGSYASRFGDYTDA